MSQPIPPISNSSSTERGTLSLLRTQIRTNRKVDNLHRRHNQNPRDRLIYVIAAYASGAFGLYTFFSIPVSIVLFAYSDVLAGSLCAASGTITGVIAAAGNCIENKYSPNKVHSKALELACDQLRDNEEGLDPIDVITPILKNGYLDENLLRSFLANSNLQTMHRITHLSSETHPSLELTPSRREILNYLHDGQETQETRHRIQTILLQILQREPGLKEHLLTCACINEEPRSYLESINIEKMPLPITSRQPAKKARKQRHRGIQNKEKGKAPDPLESKKQVTFVCDKKKVTVDFDRISGSKYLCRILNPELFPKVEVEESNDAQDTFMLQPSPFREPLIALLENRPLPALENKTLPNEAVELIEAAIYYDLNQEIIRLCKHYFLAENLAIQDLRRLLHWWIPTQKSAKDNAWTTSYLREKLWAQHNGSLNDASIPLVQMVCADQEILAYCKEIFLQLDTLLLSHALKLGWMDLALAHQEQFSQFIPRVKNKLESGIRRGTLDLSTIPNYQNIHQFVVLFVTKTPEAIRLGTFRSFYEFSQEHNEPKLAESLLSLVPRHYETIINQWEDIATVPVEIFEIGLGLQHSPQNPLELTRDGL